MTVPRDGGEKDGHASARGGPALGVGRRRRRQLGARPRWRRLRGPRWRRRRGQVAAASLTQRAGRPRPHPERVGDVAVLGSRAARVLDLGDQPQWVAKATVAEWRCSCQPGVTS